MGKSGALVKNALYLVIAGQAGRLINFFEVLFLVRYLGKNDYGIWNLGQSIPTMFFVISDLGLTSIMLRKIARRSEDRDEYVSKVLLLKLLLAIPFMASVYILVSRSHHEPHVALMIYLSSLGFMVWSLLQVAIGLFRAYQNFAFEALVNTIKSGLFFAMILGVIFFDLKLIGILIALLVSDIVVAAFAAFSVAKKFGRLHFRLYSLRAYSELIRQSIPFAMLAFFSPVFFQIGIIMLSSTAGFEAVAIYSAPFKIMLFLFVIPVALKNVLFPQLSILYLTSVDEFRAHLNDAARIATVLAFPLAVGLFMTADRVVALLFSSSYAAAAGPLRVMALWLPLSFLRSVTSVGLYASNREKYAVSIFGVGTLIAVVLNYFLIPQYSYIGASVSSVAAEAVILAAYYIRIRKERLIGVPSGTTFGIILATCIMAAGVYLSGSLNIFIQVSIAIVIYSVAAHFLGLVHKEERMAIRALKRKLSKFRSETKSGHLVKPGGGLPAVRKVLVMSPRFSLRMESSNVKRTRYLKQLGWEPLVVTTRDPTTEPLTGDTDANRQLVNSFGAIHRTFCVQRSPFRLLRKMFGLQRLESYLERLFFIPDILITWLPSAFLRVLQLIKKENISAYITCSPPESTHVIGLILKKKTNLLWIADFRDLWTTKTIVNAAPTWLHAKVYRWLEARVYNTADIIIANTEGNRRVYTEQFGIRSDKIILVSNGFDPGEIRPESSPNSRHNATDREFRIGYMGSFDKTGFPWKEFLRAMEQLFIRYPLAPVKFNLLGPVMPATIRMLQQCPVGPAIQYGGILPHSQAMSRTGENDILLLLMYETPYSKSIVPHKLYHYLAMGKPILAIAEEDGEVAAILQRTRTGAAISVRHPERIYEVLEEWFTSWRNRGAVPYMPVRDEVEKYNIVNLTGRITERLDALTSRHMVHTSMKSG